MSLLRALSAAASGSYYAVIGRSVWRFKRVTSDSLRRVGFAALEGSRAARAAAEEAAQAHREYLATFGALTPEDRQRALDGLAERDARDARKRLADMLATEEGEKAYVARCTAYVRAAVTGGGLLPEDQDQGPEVRIVLTPPAGVEIEAFRIVSDKREATEDGPEPRVWVETIPERQRVQLGLAIQRALDVSPEVLPFRKVAGPSTETGADLGVGLAAARGADLVAGGGGAGGAGA